MPDLSDELLKLIYCTIDAEAGFQTAQEVQDFLRSELEELNGPGL